MPPTSTALLTADLSHDIVKEGDYRKDEGFKKGRGGEEKRKGGGRREVEEGPKRRRNQRGRTAAEEFAAMRWGWGMRLFVLHRRLPSG